MSVSLPKRMGASVSTILAFVLAVSLAGCGVPSSDMQASGSSSSAAQSAGESSGTQSETAETAGPDTQPEGLVSANLPNHDPEVLVDHVEAASTKRVLTLDRAGALSRMVWSLGMGDSLVGRDLASDFPGIADLPLVTPGGHAIDAETVLSLQPDLILTDGSIGPTRVIQQLRDAGVEVVTVSEERSPETIELLVDDVARALDVGAAAGQAKTRIRQQLDEATQQAQSRADGRKMMILYVRGTGTAMIAGPDSGGRSLIQRLGGIDAGEALGISGTFTPLTPEALIAAAPDTFIVMNGGLESVGGLDGFVQIPGVDQTPAGQNRSVLEVPDSQLLSFGADTPGVIDAMAEALYGA